MNQGVNEGHMRDVYEQLPFHGHHSRSLAQKDCSFLTIRLCLITLKGEELSLIPADICSMFIL